MHSLTKLARCLAVSAPVVGLVVAFGPAAGASAATAASVTRNAAATRAVGAATTGTATNLSGYSDSGEIFTSVAATWVVPKVSCPTNPFQSGYFTGEVSFYVGLANGSNNQEQGGTMAKCSFGHADYYTWWETYPTLAVQTVGSKVKPGDVIKASVVRTGTGYALHVTDSTTAGNNISATQACSDCTDTSAQWMVEAPVTELGISPLPDFGTWHVTAATVKGGSKSGKISSFSHQAISMVAPFSTTTEAVPGALNTSGNAFTDTWKTS
jgi:hypothetical protein